MTLSRSSLTLITAIAVAGSALLLGLNLWERHLEREDTTLDLQTAAALRAHHSWALKYEHALLAQRLDSLRLLALARRLRAAEDSAATAQRAYQSAVAAMAGDTTTADSLRHCLDATSACVRQTAALQVANTTLIADTVTLSRSVVRWRGVADSARTVSDSLAHALRDEHAARECHVLFLKCPSRTVTFVLGLALGAGAAFTVH